MAQTLHINNSEFKKFCVPLDYTSVCEELCPMTSVVKGLFK